MYRKSRGFSLLEMLVAIAILSLSLGALYQAATGATRNVRTAERYAYGVELARSLLAQNAQVPAKGVGDAGETESGYRWEVSSNAREQNRSSRVRAELHDLRVVVSWDDGSKTRQIVLDSVVEAYR
ncbi:prepilin-type N-terminal cleavage/methylation domain-containing protein [Halioglobus maricola]|uniref:Prepilin-type N-terminal cleavage/methylation domain-containing protein n=1 Tax=Halioglobus maricola TaxID=2601894 RepID=A0A5P9NP78_9GAMM|nr:prepilin-type N-terminal cleavage/methylation domain-containing protein [Halioglobus maricola]QFU76708.1 prepilin-type N-terminal cleavage/methylation domain-containing protein [Halioglobus maricola]